MHSISGVLAYVVLDKSAETIARVSVEEWMAQKGRCPKFLIPDRGCEFENKLFQEITNIFFWVEQRFTVSFNQRKKGLTERMNKALVNMLAKISMIPLEWDRRLPFVLYSFNSPPHEVTGESRFSFYIAWTCHGRRAVRGNRRDA